jgi:transposase
VRQIDAVLDLSWVHAELAPRYPSMGRPSLDPVLMMGMLIVRYVFAIRSERALCREVKEPARFDPNATSPAQRNDYE